MPKQSYEEKILEQFKYIGWNNAILEDDLIKIDGTIAFSKESDSYTLHMLWHDIEEDVYQEKKLTKIIFPSNFDLLDYIKFSPYGDGSYRLKNQGKMESIINPKGKSFDTLKITNGDKSYKTIRKNSLIISKKTFLDLQHTSNQILKIADSYKSSTSRYLCNMASFEYYRYGKNRTTHIKPGEISFAIHKLFPENKETIKEFTPYLNNDDLKDLEYLADKLVRNGIFSDMFLQRLSDYFIKEKLTEIIQIGRKILALKSPDLETEDAKQIKDLLRVPTIKSLENLWQKYFEKYLLYLIFSYKKIYPKVDFEIEDEEKEADFIGINHYKGIDIIEIKHHLHKALIWDKAHKNFYFTPELSRAIIQTRNYIDGMKGMKFKNSTKRDVKSIVGEGMLYYPRGIIIISSEGQMASSKYRKEHPEELKRDFTKLRNSIKDVQILTFDEILDIADNYIKNIIKT